MNKTNKGTEMISMKTIRSAVMVVIASLSLLLTGAVLAADCKGKSSSACNASASCSWVKGYKRSDGAKVPSFCRAKPGKSAGEKKKAVKKKASSDSKKKTGAKQTKTKKKAVKDTKKASKKKTDKAKSEKKKVKKKASKKKTKGDKDKKKKASEKKDKKKS